MENKRKVSGVNGFEAGSGADIDRAAKRRKLQEEFGDLSKGETAQSTKAYGLNILESIRATTDKNGRPVSPFFERLPTKAENPEYYKKIRLPLSLEIIERKLNKHEYPNLSALEGDFKRLVSNAKETNTRQSEVFGDAERVRKAVSNLMVKFNPAYKAGNYQAVATPLPPTPDPDEVNGEEDAEGEEEDVEMQPAPDRDAHGEADDDAEADEDKSEEDAEGSDEEDDEPEPVVRKRRPGRPPKNATSTTPKPSRSGSAHGKTDSQYENTSYKGLTFQQAQEKIVEDTIRVKDDGGDWQYFEPFIYLPPRSLKDYYEIIAEPMSLKALQKQVRGQHGRGEATGVSDFKGWAAFEDQASLIWKNAYHYNEDGSEIFSMAQELEEHFKRLVKEAKRYVLEPPQPKIKLKIPQSAETPPVHSKKITIHVGGKVSAAGSPAPPTVQSGEADGARNGTPLARNPFGGSNAAAVNLSQLEKARSLSVSGASPSPSVAGGAVKPEEPARQSPAIPAQVSSMTTQQQFAPMGQAPAPAPNGVAAPLPPPPPPPPKRTAADILEAQKYRPHGFKVTEALMPQVVIRSHPDLHSSNNRMENRLENRLAITLYASDVESQQELVFNAPARYYRLQLHPIIAPFLEAQQREWKLNVTQNFSRVYPILSPEDKRNEPVFDINLHYGSNRLEVSLVAALPKGEKGPHGLGMEMEKFVVFFNLIKSL
ncbi:Bromodomain-containing protein [Pseudomassariella vexata]|uniref:Bromodomain-containing protein n=1 Tax=Pseudomassariella vexata TaxID=1141098 RepID=A0A1Y2D5J0_9PEZI|nr:Bromodomain-containing protein [Pseudomassariella vexata]ORY54552.1 Bromodomain-containing protein [Pseudomassariella vexata]